MDIVLLGDNVPSVLGFFSVTGANVDFSSGVKGFTVEGKPLSTPRKLDDRIREILVPVVALNSDAEDKPTILTYGSFTFQIIKRGDKLGLRVKDSQNPDRLNFKGTEFYPTNPNWCIDA